MQTPILWTLWLLLALPLQLWEDGNEPASSTRQTYTTREKILHQWPTAQQKALSQTAYLTFKRQSKRVIDSPHGTHKTREKTEIYGRPSSDHWTHQFISATINGQPANEDQLERREQRWSSALKPYMNIINQINPVSPETVAQMHPSTPLEADTLNGVPVWSFNVVAPEEKELLERATLWFRQDTLQLEQSRAIYKPTDGQSMVVTTEYIRVRGIDLPKRVHSEGILRYRRRLRSFTLLIETTALHDDFVLTPRSSELHESVPLEADSTQLLPGSLKSR